jgi:DHA3 family tetracycline resistance protein-like MFS transporter
MPDMVEPATAERRGRPRFVDNFGGALRVRAFALVWSGQFASRIGDNVYRVALAWWVLQETGSATAMGTVLIFSFTPMLLFVLLGGVVVDRVSRLRVMFWADLVRGIVTVGMAIAAFSGTLDLWTVCAASMVFGFAGAFFQPAYVAVIPEIVPRERLGAANSLTALSQQVATIGGPAMGAACIAFGGPALGFALNGGSFVVAGLVLLGLPWRSIGQAPGTARPSVFRDMREGLATVRSSTWLWATISLAALGNLALTGPMQIALPFLLKEERGEGATAFAVFLSFAAVGSVLTALGMAQRDRMRWRGVLAYGGLVGNGFMLVALGQDFPVPALWIAGFFGGVSLTLFDLIWINTIQDMVPPHLLGRVFSVDQLGSFALVPFGFAFTGWATNQFGAAEVLVASGGVLVALAGLGFFAPAIRNLD